MSDFTQFLYTSSRELRDVRAAFIGFHWPMVIDRVARALGWFEGSSLYEAGTSEDEPVGRMPTSPSDLVTVQGASYAGDSLTALFGWLRRGVAEVVMLEAPIVDQFGNVNSTAIGGYERPKVRMAGSGGGFELAAFAHHLVLVSAYTDARNYPERLDYVTSPGHIDGGDSRRRHGYEDGTGPKVLVTPMGIFDFAEGGRARLVAAHPGWTLERVEGAVGWPLVVADDVKELSAPNDAEALVIDDVLSAAAQSRYRLPEGHQA